MDENITKNLSQDIKEWVSESVGWWTYRNLDDDCGITGPESKNTRRVVIADLVKKRKITRHAQKQGHFKKVDDVLHEQVWQEADTRNVLPVLWPFGLEQYMKIFPKSVIIVGGYKQQGKTAYLYKLVHLNMDMFEIDLFNNETGVEQMKERFDGIDPDIPNPPPFKTYERYDNFSEVIHPDHISVIDYLDTNSEFYEIGNEIEKIWQRLDKGVAVIGLQKPPPQVSMYKGQKQVLTRDLAYGGAMTAKRAVLYLSLDTHILKIVHAKNPIKGMYPNGMCWSYSFNGQGVFHDINRWYPPEE